MNTTTAQRWSAAIAGGCIGLMWHCTGVGMPRSIIGTLATAILWRITIESRA